MRVVPMTEQGADLAPDRETGQEDEEDREQHGQRIASRDGFEGSAGASLLLG